MIIHLDGPDCYTGGTTVWWIGPNTRLARHLDLLCFSIPLKWFGKRGKDLRIGDCLNGGTITKIEA